MEGSWAQFVDALSARAKAQTSVAAAAAAQHSEEASRDAPLARQELAEEGYDSASSSSSEEDSRDDAAPKDGAAFTGIDLQQLKGSTVSIQSKIQQRIKKSLVKAAQKRALLRVRHCRRLVKKRNVYVRQPTEDGEEVYREIALQGVLAYFIA